MPAQRTILAVEDEPVLRQVLVDALSQAGYCVETAEDGVEAVNKVEQQEYAVVILDIGLPRLNGMDVLRFIKKRRPDIPVIIVTVNATMADAIEALKQGAYEYIRKPFDIGELERIVARAMDRRLLIDENRYLHSELKAHYDFDNVIGMTPEVQQAYLMATQVAESNATVLITGETGTGKEFLARAIHYQSGRAEKPFLKVNCGALPETLLESELFGHEKGAFTHALSRHIGRFERAHGGTLLLDEIGDISLPVQVKLLRVLQEREFERVGGTETIRVDVRVIAATHRDLEAMIREGTFRQDLYYRLNVIPIHLPPLRERAEDIPTLANHFLERYRKETGKQVTGFTYEALELLQSYDWPGNIRELENCVERAVILTRDERIDVGELFLPSRQGLSTARPAAYSSSLADGERPLRTLKEIEKEAILDTLERLGGNQSRTALVLGIDRKTLRNKMKEYGLLRSGESE
ncbi:MAG TPA: sigma-54 dependent transcriptional regulator [Armatimonadota bacterium]|nr:sigma-54 dependent transcriptional regulator [Armatimonadota bacterium]